MLVMVAQENCADTTTVTVVSVSRTRILLFDEKKGLLTY